MIALIQRVTEAKVTIEERVAGEINKGLLILLGVEKTDTPAIAEKLAQKVMNYRVFSDEDGKMNLNLQQAKGALLVVSQFTLVADTQKGNRPGFSKGASPQQGDALYNHFIQYCQNAGPIVQSGEFGADMQVALVNDGPVTFHISVN